MATAQDIAWGSYRDYEGPFYRGTQPFVLPQAPSDTERILAVITATEGERWDAYNGHDRCICTSGLIQWCEAGQFSVSDMLGKVADADRGLRAPVDALARQRGVEFRKNARGRYRFFFTDARGEVDRAEEQQQLFLLRSNGRIGSWDAESRAYAKDWAAASPPSGNTPQRSGFRARTPRHASVASLTFGPQIAIYPHRYARIRPVLETLVRHRPPRSRGRPEALECDAR